MTCPFCGRDDRPFNKEHVWPDWIGRHLLGTANAPKLVQAHGSREYKPLRLGPSLNIAIDACQVCNGGWLKALEDRSEPFLRPMVGEPDTQILLDRRRMDSLARWCLARAMVYDLRDGDVFFKADERHAFATLGALPMNTCIWIGRYIGPRRMHAYPVKVRPTGTVGNPTAYTLTWTAGYFLMQLAAWRDGAGRRPSLAPVANGRLWQLLPSEGRLEPARWPPADTFDDHLPALENRFWPPDRPALQQDDT